MVKTKRRTKPRRRLRRWSSLAVLLLLVALLAGLCHSCFGQMHRLRTAQVPDWVEVQLIPVNGTARRGEKMKEVTDIAIHYVGNPGTTAPTSSSVWQGR